MADADPIKIFNVHDAKTQLSKLLERAHAGEEIVIAKGGRPYARLMPLPTEPLPPRKFGQLKHLRGKIPAEIWFEPEYTDEELDQFDGKFGQF